MSYYSVMVMPNGIKCGLQRMIYTTALIVGIDELDNYARRYCYEDPLDALASLLAWDGAGDPPGNWLKEKPGNRSNPNLRGVPIVAERKT